MEITIDEKKRKKDSTQGILVGGFNFEIVKLGPGLPAADDQLMVADR